MYFQALRFFYVLSGAPNLILGGIVVSNAPNVVSHAHSLKCMFHRSKELVPRIHNLITPKAASPRPQNKKTPLPHRYPYTCGCARPDHQSMGGTARGTAKRNPEHGSAGYYGSAACERTPLKYN